MTIDQLARDVESLKAENRRLRRWGAALLLLALATGATAMAGEGKPPKVVEAESFVVRDPQGKHVGVFGHAGAGAITLSMHPDGDGTVPLWLRVSAGRPDITLLSRGSTRATEILPAEVRLQALVGDTIEDRATLTVDGGGAGALSVLGRDGKTLLRVPE